MGMPFKPADAVPRIYSPTVIKRLIDKVKLDPETACWLWTKSLDHKGYAWFWYDGKNHRAHRISYAIFVAELPAGMTVDHVCCNPRCCNPSHLQLLTLSENSAVQHTRKGEADDIPF